jgi:hemerythrin-like metal-binding protein
MNYPEWVQQYGVGHVGLDSYHHIFYEAVEQMDQAATAGTMGAAIERMAFLLMYCAMHFAEEESILHGVGYPELEQHQAIHQRFHRRMTTLHGELEKNPTPELAAQTAIEARQWWINHIQTEDRKFAPYLTTEE